MAETTLPSDQQVRLGVLCERLSRVHRLLDDELHKLQGELDAFGSEHGAPDIDDPRVQEILNRTGDEDAS